MWKKFEELDNVSKLLIIVIILLIIYGIVMYFKTSSTEQEENYVNKNIIVELYFSPTCGHCANFKPEWEKLIRTNACTFKSYNCQEGKCTADIKYVPALKINGQLYDGNMSADSILTQINETK